MLIAEAAEAVRVAMKMKRLKIMVSDVSAVCLTFLEVNEVKLPRWW